MSRRTGLALLIALWPAAAPAHPLAPALLELRETAPQRYEVLWRTSVAQAQGRPVTPVLPVACAVLAAMRSRIDDNEALEARWTVRCSGLARQAIAIDGIERSGINVIVWIETLDGRRQQGVIDAGEPAFIVPEPSEAAGVFARYWSLGIEHLLTGLDHLLFLLGLFLLAPRLRALVATVTAFTAGHCVTLGLATLGVLPVKQGPAELVIAASVLLLACELARPRGQPASRLWQRPWRMAGAFGLVHGLGFAGALREVGLPAGDIPLSLLAFNLGIEAAQLGVVALLLLAAWAWRAGSAAPPAARWVPVYVIGSMAACWCLERSWALWA
jgi:hydrogenase/urease accessory protein HupE